MTVRRPRLIIPPGASPEPHEIEAAEILAAHFHCNVTFIVPSRGYKMKSADFIINNVEWELKSPVGSSRLSTIQKQFNGLKQSRSIIIDGRYARKLSDLYISNKIKHEIARHHRIQKVLFITKTGHVIVCK